MNGGRDEPNGSFGSSGNGGPDYQALVKLASDLVDADCCEFLVEKGDRLIVQATSDSRPDGSNRTYPLWTGLPGRAYTTGTACVIDDRTDIRSASAADSNQPSGPESYRSLCCVPIDGQGLLLAKARQPGAFTEADRDRVERLVQVARAWLDRTSVEHTPALDGGHRNAGDHSERLEEIADILSHDLKNPLSVALGNLELALETGEDQFIEKASGALQRIEELIDGVVLLARTGELVEAVEVVSLQDRVQAAWENVRTERAELHIEESIEFEASKRGVNHLLENIIDNAITHGGPEVTVRVGTIEDGFYIDDDGPGIPAEHHDRVFERGYSLDSESSGLGLHIVKRIAAAHHWNVDVTEAPDGGARFEFTGVQKA